MIGHNSVCCRIIAKWIRLFPNLTDLSGRGKSVELKQTTKQTNKQARKNTLSTYRCYILLGITSLRSVKLHGKKEN